MPIATHAPVLSFAELLRRFERFVPEAYDDGVHLATIGIGINLRLRAYVALVLKEIGVFAADLTPFTGPLAV